MLRTNNEKEYYSSILGTYLLANGIILHSSYIKIPQQNKVIKRNNRHFF